MDVTVAATGSFLPETLVPNRVLERRFGLPEGLLEQVFGVRERHYAAPHQATSDLAVEAATRALEAHDPANVRLLLVATSTPDHITPATAPLVAHRLGLRCAASDITNTCSGFLYAFSLATRFLAGEAEGATALVVGANVLSRRVDWNDWRTAGLFADGAGSVLLQNGGPGAVRSFSLSSDGSGYDRIQVPAGGSRLPLTVQAAGDGLHLLRLRDPPTASESAAVLEREALNALGRAGWRVGDVDLFLPHPASLALVRAATDALGIPDARTECTLPSTGNTSAASLPIALDRAARAGRLRERDKVLLSAVAAGTVAAATCVEWGAGP